MSSAATEAVVLAFPTHSRVSARTPVRLTRRGRVVVRIVLLAAVVAAVLAALLVLPLTATAGSEASAVPAAFRTVLPGETLWQIAVEVAPWQDPRDTIASIVELNGLETVRIQPGQMLAVPAAAG